MYRVGIDGKDQFNFDSAADDIVSFIDIGCIGIDACITINGHMAVSIISINKQRFVIDSFQLAL